MLILKTIKVMLTTVKLRHTIHCALCNISFCLFFFKCENLLSRFDLMKIGKTRRLEKLIYIIAESVLQLIIIEAIGGTILLMKIIPAPVQLHACKR